MFLNDLPRFAPPAAEPFDDPIDPATTGLNRALAALRNVTVYDRESVYAVLTCLAAQMKDSGFGDDDIEAVDAAGDWVRDE